jgi:hypothetical protein
MQQASSERKPSRVRKQTQHFAVNYDAPQVSIDCSREVNSLCLAYLINTYNVIVLLVRGANTMLTANENTLKSHVYIRVQKNLTTDQWLYKRLLAIMYIQTYRSTR